MSRGADVASYQGHIDFDALKGEVDFLIAKCTEGTGYRDPTFVRNWTESRRVGIRPGAYHFARPDLGLSAEDEAAYFVSSMQPLERGDIIALDYEVSFDDPVGWCKAWLDDVRLQTGFTPYIYLNLSLVNGHDWKPVIDAGYPLWLAYYDENPDALPKTPWPSVAIKQWTSSGKLAGIPAPRVDLNTAFGGDTVADTPQRMGQSADLTLKPGEVGLIQGIWHWPNGTERAIVRKVWGHMPGRRVYFMYPPVDPDADQTEHVDAEPAIFTVTITK